MYVKPDHWVGSGVGNSDQSTLNFQREGYASTTYEQKVTDINVLKWRIAHDGKAKFQRPEYVFGYADVHLARNDYSILGA